MKVDVVIPTKNSVEPCLKECLESIYREVPICHLIVVDADSTDDTLAIISRKPRVKILHDKCHSLAYARQIAIENVDSRFFAFVDSDVVLYDGWFRVMMSLMKADVGAVEGLAHLYNPMMQRYAESMKKLRRLLRRKGIVTYWGRGLTVNTLIRTEAVRGIRIPRWLKVYEDHFIRSWIEGGGFRWTRTKEPVALHIEMGKPTSIPYYTARCAYRLGFLSLRSSLKDLVTVLPKSLFAALDWKDPALLVYHVRRFVQHVAGVLSEMTYLKRHGLKRFEYKIGITDLPPQIYVSDFKPILRVG